MKYHKVLSTLQYFNLTNVMQSQGSLFMSYDITVFGIVQVEASSVDCVNWKCITFAAGKSSILLTKLVDLK